MRAVAAGGGGNKVGPAAHQKSNEVDSKDSVMSKINVFFPLRHVHMTYGSQRHNNMAAKFS